MIEIRALRYFDRKSIEAVMADGYTSLEKYEITRRMDRGSITFEARRTALAAPYQKVWDVTEEDLARYALWIKDEPCFAAFDGDRMVGIALGK